MLPYISNKNIIKSTKVPPELKTFWQILTKTKKLYNFDKNFDKQIGQLTDRTDFIGFYLIQSWIRFYLDVPVPRWPYLELVLVPVSIFGLNLATIQFFFRFPALLLWSSTFLVWWIWILFVRLKYSQQSCHFWYNDPSNLNIISIAIHNYIFRFISHKSASF